MGQIVVRAPVRAGAELGSWRLVKAMGRGGMGVVYQAEHTGDGRRAALKILHAISDEEESARASKRFVLEIQAVQRIAHLNVVRFFDSGSHETEDGAILLWYAMELVDGTTLADLVSRLGAIPVPAASAIIRQAALGLHAAHAQGILHRDIKPENIMLGHDGRVVVVDFGICKFQDDAHHVTATGQVIGTGRYLTPEHFCGMPLDARSDAFALGAVLFFLVTGNHLRKTHAVQELLNVMSTQADLKCVQEARDLPPALRRVLNNVLAADPEHRYADAQVFADALESVVQKLAAGVDAAQHISLLLDQLREAPLHGDATLAGEDPTNEQAVVPVVSPPSSPPRSIVWSAHLGRAADLARTIIRDARVVAVKEKARELVQEVREDPRRFAHRAVSPERRTATAVVLGAITLIVVGIAAIGGRHPDPVRAPSPAAAPARATTKTKPQADMPAPEPSVSPAAPSVAAEPSAAPTESPAPAPHDVAPPVTAERPIAAPQSTAATSTSTSPKPALAAGEDPSAAPLYADDRDVENQPLYVGEERAEDERQRKARECALWAAAVGAPPGSCPTPAE